MTHVPGPADANGRRLRAGQALVGQLRQHLAQTYGEPPVLIETHISWVLLAGQDAWKLKKPLQLDFLDYSTPELRRQGCEEELRINRRTAPDYYLGVQAVTGRPEQPALGGQGPVLDWALHMRRFPRGSLLAERLQQDEVPDRVWPALARQVAALHQCAAVAEPGSRWGQPQAVLQAAQDNFTTLLQVCHDNALRQTLQQLQSWSAQQAQQMLPLMQRRLQQGRVRECHGDLHLGNLLLIDGDPVLFDAIEFNSALRWIDVLADVAFLVMDLDCHQRADLGWRVFNHWLERTGDYEGLALLPFYLAYRALVRAKVAALQAQQSQGEARARCWRDVQAHVALALRYSQPRPPWLWITHGCSGAGKSTLSWPLLGLTGMVRLRADVERKRLFGLEPEASSQGKIAGGIYTAQAHTQTFERLATLAQAVLAAGYPVLVDATFLKTSVRARFRELAQEAQVPFGIVSFQAPAEVLRARIQQRLQAGKDASEADVAVLEAQLAGQDPLQPGEMDHTLVVDATRLPDWPQLLAQQGWRHALR